MVAIDGQTDFYGEALTRDYLQVFNTGPGWETTLDRFGVSWVIFPVTSPLTIQIDNSPNWVRRYKDDIAGSGFGGERCHWTLNSHIVLVNLRPSE